MRRKKDTTYVLLSHDLLAREAWPSTETRTSQSFVAETANDGLQRERRPRKTKGNIFLQKKRLKEKKKKNKKKRKREEKKEREEFEKYEKPKKTNTAEKKLDEKKFLRLIEKLLVYEVEEKKKKPILQYFFSFH